MVHTSKNIFFIALVWLIFHPFLSDEHQDEHKERHFLHYKSTVLTKSDTFPEFSAEVVADGRRIKLYSNEGRVWILTEDDWTEPPEPPDSRDWFIHQIRTLTNCTNSQCSELHVLQRIIGCKLEKLPDGTVNLTVFDEYGFDGEDFISFNSDTVQWIDKNPKAKETKKKWDLHTERNKFLKYYLKNCIDWISTFNNTKQSSPDVRVFARKAAPDDHSKLVLTCLATGFYPRDVQMNIRLNRNILEDQTSSGIRPNDDETFQMRISVKIDRNYEGSYDCLFNHSSLTEPVLTGWEIHNVYYRFTVLTKADTFPLFSAVGIYDDKQFIYYSNEDENWIRENLTEYDGIEPLPEPDESKDWYKKLLYILANCTVLQCSELHVLQRIIGCELEKLPDGTVNLTVFDEYGFDGEGFISFNSDTVQWIDKNPKAKETKEEWDRQTGRNKFTKDYLTNCMNWISTISNTNKSSPDVHIFARKSPDDDSNLVLTCLATGFYPRDIEMNIRLDRNILEDQTFSGIRPNEDETFQMSTSVKIDRNHKGSYDCLVIHSNLTVTAEWDGKCSNCELEHRWDVIGGVTAVIGLVLVIGYLIYTRRRSNGDEDTTAAANEAETSTSSASLMTWRRNYGSMENQSQNDQSEDDQLQNDQSQDDQSQNDQSEDDQLQNDQSQDDQLQNDQSEDDQLQNDQSQDDQLQNNYFTL